MQTGQNSTGNGRIAATASKDRMLNKLGSGLLNLLIQDKKDMCNKYGGEEHKTKPKMFAKMIH